MTNKLALACVLWLSVLALGCGANGGVTSTSAESQPVETTAEMEYASAYKQLMVDWRDSEIKRGDELDEAIEKGLPNDSAERRTQILDLAEIGDKRTEAILARANAITPPEAYTSFDDAVIEFLTDVVNGNADYATAERDGESDKATKIMVDNIETMKENYEKMRVEGQKLGIDIAAFGE